MTSEQRRDQAAYFRDYAERRKAGDPAAWRAAQRKYAARQRLAIIEFLGGRCYSHGCTVTDHRGLVIVQAADLDEDRRLSPNELYSLVRADPELARATLSLRCATCRQIERFDARG